MQIYEETVIQMLASVLDEPACAVAIKDGGHIRLNATDLRYLIKRAAEQERAAMLKELDTWSDLKAGKVAMLIRARQLEPA